jgi:hypothetical protein
LVGILFILYVFCLLWIFLCPEWMMSRGDFSLTFHQICKQEVQQPIQGHNRCRFFD